MGAPVLAGKKFLAVIRTSKWFELGFEVRLVYSFLVFRARTARGKGTDQSEIARFLGIDRGETVPRALLAMKDVGLARKDEDGLWWATEPKGEVRDWFGWQDKVKSAGKPWYGRFRFFTIYFPAAESRLTLRQIALYFLLWSLAYQPDDPANDFLEGQSVKGFARLLCVSRPTIDDALEVLRDEGLIKYAKATDGNDLGVRLYPIRAEQEGWFRDAKERRLSVATGRARYPGLFDDAETEGVASVVPDEDAASSEIVHPDSNNQDEHHRPLTKPAEVVPARRATKVAGAPSCDPEQVGAGHVVESTRTSGLERPGPLAPAGDDSLDEHALSGFRDWTPAHQLSHERFLRRLRLDPGLSRTPVREKDAEDVDLIGILRSALAECGLGSASLECGTTQEAGSPT